MELIEAIHKAVHELDEKMEVGSEDYNAACLILLLYKCTFDSWGDIEQGAPRALGINADQIFQMIVNLRLGGALLEDGFHTALRQDLEGEASGITVLILINVAAGRMEYLPDHGTFRLTALGTDYIEAKMKE